MAALPLVVFLVIFSILVTSNEDRRARHIKVVAGGFSTNIGSQEKPFVGITQAGNWDIRRFTGEELLEYPQKCVGLFIATDIYPNQVVYNCSAFIAGHNRLVVTAAHCACRRGSGKMFQAYVFVQRFDHTKSYDEQRKNFHYLSDVTLSPNWDRYNNTSIGSDSQYDYDYAFAILKKNQSSDVTACNLPLFTHGSVDIPNNTVVASYGYVAEPYPDPHPDLAPFVPNQLRQANGTYYVEDDNDTLPSYFVRGNHLWNGSSGGPMIWHRHPDTTNTSVVIGIIMGAHEQQLNLNGVNVTGYVIRSAKLDDHFHALKDEMIQKIQDKENG